jgi:hypothetical protein
MYPAKVNVSKIETLICFAVEPLRRKPFLNGIVATFFRGHHIRIQVFGLELREEVRTLGSKG